MAKQPSREEEFQQWLADFRAGRPCTPVFLALETNSDDELRKLWTDSTRYWARMTRKPRPRRPNPNKYPGKWKQSP
jgi:hypothetical protein